jgi:hypothetical protein
LIGLFVLGFVGNKDSQIKSAGERHSPLASTLTLPSSSEVGSEEMHGPEAALGRELREEGQRGSANHHC